MPSIRWERRQLDEGRAREPLPVAPGEPVTTLPEPVELLQLAQPEGGLEVGQPVVVAEFRNLVAPGTRGVGMADPVVAHRAESLGQVLAVGQHGAPLAGRHLLGRVEGERRHVGERPHRPVPEGAPDRMGRVGDQDPLVLAREREQPVVVAGQAREVHGQDDARARRRQALHRVRIEVQRLPVDVGEDRSGALIDDRVRGRGEGQRRRDRPVTGSEPRRPARGVERGGAVREGHGVFHPPALGQAALEPRQGGPLGDPVRGERLAHGGDVAGIDRLPGVRQEGPPHARAAYECELLKLLHRRASLWS